LWETDKNSAKRRKKNKKFKKMFFQKDSKNSNLDCTRNVVNPKQAKLIVSLSVIFLLIEDDLIKLTIFVDNFYCVYIMKQKKFFF
jgi:hypothetical protein